MKIICDLEENFGKIHLPGCLFYWPEAAGQSVGYAKHQFY